LFAVQHAVAALRRRVQDSISGTGGCKMASTARIGLILGILLLGWVIIYYQLVAPALEEPAPPPGLALTTGDSVGTSPDETEPKIIENNDPIPGTDGEGESNSHDLNGDDDDASAEGSNRQELEEPILPAPPATTPYAVMKDDTMQTIAQQWFGSSAKWVLIAQENPLAEPMKLQRGQVLRLPPKDAKPESIPPELYAELTKEIRYVVSPGDTLSGIAKRFYNKPSLYRIIFDANRDVIRNPDNLVTGVEIVIPKYQQPAE
jgi:nucleoid-associated protein YgaU